MEMWTPKIYTTHGFVKKNILSGKRAIDIGCGGRKLPGADGMDMLALPGVDIVHNLNIVPWPIADHTYDLVIAHHSLEHVADVVKTMEEIYRVLKPSGRFVMQAPYFRSVDAFSEPTHKSYFSSHSLDYFIEGTPLFRYTYSGAKFAKKGFWFGWPRDPKNPIKRVLKKFINTHADIYDAYLSRLFPTKCVTWEIETLK